MNDRGLRAAYEAVTGEERAARLRLFTAAMGVVALKDLQNHDVLRGAIELGGFSYPYVRLPLLDNGRWLGAVLLGSQLVAMVAALLLVAQRHVRAAALVLVGLYGYPFLVDRVRYTNNGYLLLLMLGLVALANADARPRVPAFPGWMGRVLVSVVYLTAAAAKLDADWLSGYLMGQSLRHYHYIYASRVAFYDQGLFQIAAIGTVAVEIGLAVLPWVRHRLAWPIAAALALTFHGLIELALPVRCFSYLMIASFLLSAPPWFVARVVRLRLSRWPILAAGSGAALAIFVNLVTAHWLGAYPLVAGFVPLTMAALATTAAIVHVSGRPQRSTRGPITPTRRRLRAALLLGWTVAHLGLVVKPALGGTNAFAWRMFTEDLKLEVALSLQGPGPDWRASPLHGAIGVWSANGYLHHWSSWGEQRVLLERYADWLLDRYPGLTGVELTVLAQRNEAPWETHVIRRTRPARAAPEPTQRLSIVFQLDSRRRHAAPSRHDPSCQACIEPGHRVDGCARRALSRARRLPG